MKLWSFNLLLFLLLMCAGPAFSGTAAAPEADRRRDALWTIVSSCFPAGAGSHPRACRWPGDAGAADCRDSTTLWDIDPEFILLRDIKMCDCLGRTDFFHALAVPRMKVTGSESPNRPRGIWRFAWENASRWIDDPMEIALVVNPPGNQRGQDQLHVHLVRLNRAGRSLVDRSPRSAAVDDLGDVWKAAERLAAMGHLGRYGVLVAKRVDGSFAVIVDAVNQERRYSEATCPVR